MFCTFALLALVAPLASALTLNIPTNPVSSGPVTITWTATSADLPFSLFLNNEVFHDNFAIANNVDPSLQTLSLTIPAVTARDGYTLVATNPGNISDVLTTTGTFSIAPNPSSTISATASTASQISVSSSSSSSGTVTTSKASTTTTSFGSTLTGSTTSAGSNTVLTSQTSTAPSSSASAFNSSAGSLSSQLSFMHSGVLSGMLLSVIAGAAFLTL